MEKLTSAEKALFKAARDAQSHAHAPYSKFPVGAAVPLYRGAAGALYEDLSSVDVPDNGRGTAVPVRLVPVDAFDNVTDPPAGAQATLIAGPGLVIAERPDGVRETIRASLVANPSSLSQAIKAGKSTFDAAGGPRAYFGDPAAATADEGARLIDALGAILEEAVSAEI